MIEVAPDGLTLAVGPLTLRPHAAFDTVDAPDETLEVLPPRVDDGRIVLERRSTVWERALTTVAHDGDQVELRFEVHGRGVLTEVSLLALRALLPARPTGLLPSGSGLGALAKLYCPNPAHATGTRPLEEPAVIGVTGDGDPGRHHWFFTPAPLYLAFGMEDEGDWLDLGLAAPVGDLTFVEAAYAPRDGGFHLRLEYEGHTRVDGAFAAPALVLTTGVPDPVTGLRRHRDDLAARGAAPPVTSRATPSWWAEPMFCGWGAQMHLAQENGGSPMAQATQGNYDDFLAQLEGAGLEPGTVVIDDKWQAAYGTNEPDPAKWPDLKGWIAGQHARGRKVLLWWKAWDPEGLDPALCVRTREGVPVAVDPSNPALREELARQLRALLGPEGLDADGLKIDFTARTPSGRALVHQGPEWGIALLHRLLAAVRDGARAAKADALLVTQTPHPAFVDVADMIRLNDMIGGHASVVPQMRYRADVARAACPELLVDTDDWRVPSLAAWREFQHVKPELGVPSLYYTTHVDATGEAFEDADYHLLRGMWNRYREGRP
jgi:hypothetical protein